MSECKHETIGFRYDDDGRSTPYCTKCKMSSEQLVSELQQMIADRDATIASQDRQLDAAAKDIRQQTRKCGDCPVNDCRAYCDEGCEENWRKRWKEIADNG